MRVSQHLAKRSTSGGLDPRLAAVAGWLAAAKAQATNVVHAQEQAVALTGRKKKIDYGRPGLGKTRYERRRTVEVRRRGYDITKRVQPEPFNITNIVLDLDAENSPFIRVFGTERDKNGELRPVDDQRRQKEIWNYDPKLDQLVERIRAFKYELRDSEDRWYAPPEPLDPRRISSRDIVQVMLLGPKSQPGKARNSNRAPTATDWPVKAISMANVLQENGIPYRIINDDIKTLRFMFAWRKTHPLEQQPKPAAGSSPTQPLDFETSVGSEQKSDSDQLGTSAVTPWPTVDHLRRSLAPQLESGGSTEFLSFWHDIRERRRQIPSCLQTVSRGPKAGENPAEVLSFLNNMALNLGARDAHIPGPLANMGIELAFQTRNLAAVPNFLPGNEWAGTTLVDRAGRLLDDPETTVTERLELFTILTGQGLSRKLPHRPSVRTSMSDSMDYEGYFHLLGRLGAVRSLWHQWHQWRDEIHPNKHERLSEILFGALLNYKALRHCQPRSSEVIAPVSGDMAEDMYLDARDMVRFTSLSQPVEHASSTTDDLRDDCMQAMDMDDIVVAMNLLRGLLLAASGREASLEVQDSETLAPRERVKPSFRRRYTGPP